MDGDRLRPSVKRQRSSSSSDSERWTAAFLDPVIRIQYVILLLLLLSSINIRCANNIIKHNVSSVSPSLCVPDLLCAEGHTEVSALNPNVVQIFYSPLNKNKEIFIHPSIHQTGRDHSLSLLYNGFKMGFGVEIRPSPRVYLFIAALGGGRSCLVLG